MEINTRAIAMTFLKIFEDTPNPMSQQMILKAAQIDTLLGPVIVVADDTTLYMLEFVTKRKLEKEVVRLRARGFIIVPGDTPAIQSIKKELHDYFKGTLTQFKTPYCILGSPFQQQVWQALCRVSYGETRSYREQAISLGKPTAFRAVANANGANQLSIIIPCHRIIASDGTLGGYGGGLAIKKWLLEHEKRYKRSSLDSDSSI